MLGYALPVIYQFRDTQANNRECKSNCVNLKN